MDFHSLTRKELQSLCKLNKIPANITNIAMADALQSLQIVAGIEEFLKVSQSETADLGEKDEVPSPKAPHTRCRTSTRQKAKLTDKETLASTVTRTTRRGSKQRPSEVEDSKNNLMQTPAILSRRNVSYRLNECENEAKEENKYSTRRSSRLTEKKSAASRVKKEIEKVVEIDSFVDVTSKEPEQFLVETEVKDICNAFDKLGVLVMEEEATHKSGKEDEVNNTKKESHETSNSCEDSLNISVLKSDKIGVVKPESDGISTSPAKEVTNKSGEDSDEVYNNMNKESHETSNSCEDGLKISEVKIDEICDVKPESDGISSPSEEATRKSGEEDVDCDEVSNILKQELHQISNSCEDEDQKDNLNSSEVKNDVKPDSDDISSPSEEAAHKSLEEDVDCDEVCNNQNQELHEISNSCEDEDQNDNLNSSEVKIDVKPDSDDISSLCEDEKLVQKLDLGVSCMSAMKEHNHVLVQEENSDSDDISVSFEDDNLEKKLSNINMPHVPTKSLTMVIDDNENPIDEIAIKEIAEMSEYQTVDETFYVIPVDSTMSKEAEDLKPEVFTENNFNENSDAESGQTNDAAGHPAHMAPIMKATPLKNMPTVVSDDKENIVDEGKVKTKSLHETSIRQLKKQLKALTLKNLSSKEEAAAASRPALQTLCENQKVVGAETEN